jgi:transcriptional regulator GlxA family with amidase domain
MDVLRIANVLNGNGLYKWSHQVANNGDFGFTECDPNQTIVLAGGIFDPWLPTDLKCGQIRKPLRTAARVCVVGSAIFVPLCAGILKTQRAAVHTHFRAAVKERGYLNDFHEGTVCHQPLLSSAVSPLAAVEMMIELIGAQDGAFIEAAIKDQLGLVSNQSATRSREYWHFKRMAQGNIVVSQALDIMLVHLEDTLTVSQISRKMGVSSRRLERNFREKINFSPLKVYRSLRLEKVEKLLFQTELPISEISIACGFSNVTLLTKWYKRKFGVQPSMARRSAYIGKSAA